MSLRVWFEKMNSVHLTLEFYNEEMGLDPLLQDPWILHVYQERIKKIRE